MGDGSTKEPEILQRPPEISGPKQAEEWEMGFKKVPEDVKVQVVDTTAPFTEEEKEEERQALEAEGYWAEKGKRDGEVISKQRDEIEELKRKLALAEKHRDEAIDRARELERVIPPDIQAGMRRDKRKVVDENAQAVVDAIEETAPTPAAEKTEEREARLRELFDKEVINNPQATLQSAKDVFESAGLGTMFDAASTGEVGVMSRFGKKGEGEISMRDWMATKLIEEGLDPTKPYSDENKVLIRKSNAERLIQSTDVKELGSLRELLEISAKLGVQKLSFGGFIYDTGTMLEATNKVNIDEHQEVPSFLIDKLRAIRAKA